MQFGSLTSVELSVLPSPPDDDPVARVETLHTERRGSQPQIKNGRKYNHEKTEGQAHLY